VRGISERVSALRRGIVFPGAGKKSGELWHYVRAAEALLGYPGVDSVRRPNRESAQGTDGYARTPDCCRCSPLPSDNRLALTALS